MGSDPSPRCRMRLSLFYAAGGVCCTAAATGFEAQRLNLLRKMLLLLLKPLLLKPLLLKELLLLLNLHQLELGLPAA